MKKISGVCILLLILAVDIFAADLSSASQVSSKSLLQLLDSDYSKYADIDDNGLLIIREDGIKLAVESDEQLSFIEFFAVWKKRENISDNRLYKILNEWNKTEIFATVFTYNDFIVMKYFLRTTGGIKGTVFNGTISVLFYLANRLDHYLESEDAI